MTNTNRMKGRGTTLSYPHLVRAWQDPRYARTALICSIGAMFV